jgi:hypothetical protein
MASVIIHGDPAEAAVELNVNGRKVRIARNTLTEIPDALLPALQHSSFSFEAVPTDSAPRIVGEDGGEAGMQGVSSAAETKPEIEPAAPVVIDPTFLDRSVAAIIPDLAEKGLPELAAIRKAEEDGKTRKSLIAEIEALVAAKTEG